MSDPRYGPPQPRSGRPGPPADRPGPGAGRPRPPAQPGSGQAGRPVRVDDPDRPRPPRRPDGSRPDAARRNGPRPDKKRKPGTTSPEAGLSGLLGPVRKRPVTVAVLVVVVLAGLMLWRAVSGGDENSTEAGPTGNGLPAVYDVNVTLNNEVADPERAAIEAAMRQLPSATGAVRYESREQAWDRYKALFSDSPDLLANVKPGVLPASLRIGVSELTDCTVLDPVRALPGVNTVTVRPAEGRPAPAPSASGPAVPAC